MISSVTTTKFSIRNHHVLSQGVSSEASRAMNAIPDNEPEFTLERRYAVPAHFLVKIESFSLLHKHGIKEYVTNDFAVGEYKWKLVIYLDDDGHISAQLAVAETTSLAVGWEINAMFSFFVFDQISDHYLCFKGMVRRFHEMRHEWKISKLITKKALEDASNGYIVDDKCVFGTEVHVIRSQYTTGHLLLKDIDTYKQELEISGFLELKDLWTSKNFKAGNFKWNLQIYPNGDSRQTGKSISVFLRCVDVSPTKKVKAHFLVTIKDQLNGSNNSRNGSNWFQPSNGTWGWPKFAPISDILDPKKGFVVNGRCVVEVEISVQAVSHIAP